MHVMRWHVPLHSPVDGLRLRKRMTGTPILSLSLCKGRFGMFTVLRYSVMYKLSAEYDSNTRNELSRARV